MGSGWCQVGAPCRTPPACLCTPKFYTVLGGCSALGVLLICLMCMTPSASMHVSVCPRATYSKRLAGHEFCIVCTSKCLLCSGVHSEGVTWRQSPPGLGGNRRTSGGGGG